MLGLVLMLPGMAMAQTPAKTTPATSGTRPKIEIPVMSFDFGTMYHQDQYAHEFTVRNRGNAELLIQDVKPG